MSRFSVLYIFLFISVFCSGQQLKRMASKGFLLAPVTEELVQKLSLSEKQGFYINGVVPGSTAEALKVFEGDVLLKINNTPIKDIADFNNPDVVSRDGDKIMITVNRNGRVLILEGKAVGIPFEKSDILDIEYSSFDFMSGKIRSIYLKPKTEGKKPAILFIPGYPCTSVDNLQDVQVYKKLLYGLAEKGYIVMRAEKPGMGDSFNTPNCNEIDFMTEVESFRTALAALKEHPEVDMDNIFILGHSMGGMEAPFVAKDNNVKGIIAMGITIKYWLEYLTEMLRVQNPNLGIDFLQNEKDLKLYETLLFELLVNKKTPSQMIKINPDYERMLKRDFNYAGGDDFLTRSIRFSQTLNDVNIVEAWADTSAKVLSAWGETDIQTVGDFSHRELVKIVNTYHPGNATLLVLKDTDHSFRVIPDMEESYKFNYDRDAYFKYLHHFNTKAIDQFDAWMKSVMKNN